MESIFPILWSVLILKSYLNSFGKEILIKAVAQSIPTYTICVFQLSMKLYDELDAMCAKFWWGQVGNERKIHWRRWDKLATPKKGGMGFRDLRAFNLTMLAKQGWRLLQEDDSLLFKCFKARYFPRSNFLEAVVSPNCSFVWRSIMATLPILKKGCCWRVGDGYSIRVHEDRWIPNHPTNTVLYPASQDTDGILVVDLLDLDLHCWRRELITSLFHTDDAEAICSIPLSQ